MGTMKYVDSAFKVDKVHCTKQSISPHNRLTETKHINHFLQ